MSKVITFSRTFPAYHPRKGEPTLFIEKFWNSFSVQILDQEFYVPFEDDLMDLNKALPFGVLYNFKAFAYGSRYNVGSKHHTIRSGHRFKAGDYFSPRVWSGKSYQSKQIIIAPDTLIQKVYDFKIIGGVFFINWVKVIDESILHEIAKNDGLARSDLFKWFKYPADFNGQIICWSDKINY